MSDRAGELRPRGATRGAGATLGESMAAKKHEDRFAKLESAQRETNRKLGKIEQTLATSSRIFELMHQRLEHLETGQERLIESHERMLASQERMLASQDRMLESQERVIARLDLLVEGSMRTQTAWVDRFGRIEERVGRLESRVFPEEPR